MFDNFVKWIKCASCVKTTIIGLKASLIAIGPGAVQLATAVGYHPTELDNGIGYGIAVLGLILTVMEKTSAAMVKDAKDIEGVQVHVDTSVNPETGKPNAPASVVKLANSPMPDVFPMVGGPRVPSDHEDAPEPETVDVSKRPPA